MAQVKNFDTEPGTQEETPSFAVKDFNAVNDEIKLVKVNATLDEKESLFELKKEGSEEAINTAEYSDDFFEKIKEALSEPQKQLKTVKYIQTGTRLIFYQGLKSNVYGVIEKREGKSYKIRIHNSYLLRFFKTNPLTRKYFEDIL